MIAAYILAVKLFDCVKKISAVSKVIAQAASAAFKTIFLLLFTVYSNKQITFFVKVYRFQHNAFAVYFNAFLNARKSQYSHKNPSCVIVVKFHFAVIKRKVAHILLAQNNKHPIVC